MAKALADDASNSAAPAHPYRLDSTESDILALRAEVMSLDRRLAALERSIFLRLLRAVGGYKKVMTLRASQLLIRSKLHTVLHRIQRTSRNVTEHQRWLQAHRASDPLSVIPNSLVRTGPDLAIALVIRDSRRACVVNALDSILAQNYPNWRLTIYLSNEAPHETRDWLRGVAMTDFRVAVVDCQDEPSAATLNAWVSHTAGELFVFLDEDVHLEPAALAHIAALFAASGCDLIYSDEGACDLNGLSRYAVFKPSYSPELLSECMYFGRLFVVSRSAFARAGGFQSDLAFVRDHQLARRAAAVGARVRHIPRVLYHCREPQSWSGSRLPLHVSTLRLATLDSRLRATIIIPSRTLRLLESCLASIRDRTRDAAFEIVVAHHRGGPDESQIASLLDRQAVDFVDYHGGFNYSAICNLAASRANGSTLVFLNDDATPLNPDWLANLLATVSRDGVGVAGARMFYPDGTLQHAGIALGLCDGTGHPGRGQFDSAHWPWINFTRNVSAVSGACLAVPRKVFEELGGFDPVFPLNYNDVDLCLRASQARYRIVVDASVRLTHLEARSRAAGTEPGERLEFFRRWGHLVEAGDPFYSPHLRTDAEDLRIAN